MLKYAIWIHDRWEFLENGEQHVEETEKRMSQMKRREEEDFRGILVRSHEISQSEVTRWLMSGVALIN